MTFKVKIDRNGNRVCQVKPDAIKGSSYSARAFSIQTNGNLPETHRKGVGSHTRAEVWAFVVKFGTARQMAAIPNLFPPNLTKKTNENN